MNQKNLVALLVWAQETENTFAPIEETLKGFIKNGEKMQEVYTDPDDPLLFMPDVAEQDAMDFFTDYVLCYAQMDVNSGLRDYGKTINDYLLS